GSDRSSSSASPVWMTLRFHGGTGGEQCGGKCGTFGAECGTSLPIRALFPGGCAWAEMPEVPISSAFSACIEGRRICATDTRRAHGAARNPCGGGLAPLSQTAPPDRALHRRAGLWSDRLRPTGLQAIY